jgi:superfamily II DNA or RNA helicase
MDIKHFVEQTYAKSVTITLKNEVQCIVSGLHPDDSKYFEDQFAYLSEGYFFKPKYKLGVWDGKVRFFTSAGNTYNHLLDQIIPTIKSFGYKIKLNDKRVGVFEEVDPIDKDYFQHITNPKTNEPYQIRPYQIEAVNKLTADGGGIVVAATSAGKTTINAALVDLYGKKGLRSITVVPNISLVSQTTKAFRAFELDVGEYSGDLKDTNHLHVVSTWQALQYNPKMVSEFDVLVIDECQGAKANVIGTLIKEYGKNIAHRFGLTGTFPKNKADAMTINTSLGFIKYTIPAEVLIKDGWLATPNITIIQLDDQDRFNQLLRETSKPNNDTEKFTYDNETAFLQQDKVRLQWIADFVIEKGSAYKGNVLCLVNSIKIGKKLSKIIPSSKFLYGKDKQKVRQAVYDLFETFNDLIVIATVQIAGVGLSIDRIFNLIFIDGGKSFVRVIQAIGRGLRIGKDKDSVDIIDICGNLEYSRRHLSARIKYYKEAKYKHKKIVVNYNELVDV